MLPAVTCRRERETAKDILGISGFEYTSRFVQATIMFGVFAVPDAERRAMRRWVMGKASATLFKAARMLVLCNV